MEKLSSDQEAVLEVLDARIERLEEKLKKAQPLMNRLNKLKQVRRVLLNEKGTTGGGGNGRTQLAQEEVIRFLREKGPSQPAEIAEALGVPGATVRSHLYRGRDTTYRDDGNGWEYIGE